MDVRIGTEAKGDCIATVTSEKGPKLSVTTKAAQLLEGGLRKLAEETLSRMGVGDACLDLADAGSLDYVVAARIEAAVRVARPDDAVAIAPQVERQLSAADRPRRSRLYAPGNNPRLLAGIDIHGADCVLLKDVDALYTHDPRRAVNPHLSVHHAIDADGPARLEMSRGRPVAACRDRNPALPRRPGDRRLGRGLVRAGGSGWAPGRGYWANFAGGALLPAATYFSQIAVSALTFSGCLSYRFVVSPGSVARLYN